MDSMGLEGDILLDKYALQENLVKLPLYFSP